MRRSPFLVLVAVVALWGALGCSKDAESASGKSPSSHRAAAVAETEKAMGEMEQGASGGAVKPAVAENERVEQQEPVARSKGGSGALKHAPETSPAEASKKKAGDHDFRNIPRPRLPEPSRRQPVPEIELTDIEGNRFSLSSLKGDVVLLVFWATWCRPCLREVPILVSLQDEYRDAGLRVVAVSLDRGGMAKVKRFLESRPEINYTVVPNGISASMRMGGIRSIPTSFLIDRQGRVIERFVGLHPAIELEGYVQAALLE